MRKNMLFLATFGFLGTIALATATAVFNSDNSMFAAAEGNTVAHTITFTTVDERNTGSGKNEYNEDYVCFDCTKQNATRSGADFSIDAQVVGEGDKSVTNSNFLIVSQNLDTSESLVLNTIEIEFDLKNVASFESVVLNGRFTKDQLKRQQYYYYQDTFTADDQCCNYNTYRGYVRLTLGIYYEATISSIEINYSCAL